MRVVTLFSINQSTLKSIIGDGLLDSFILQFAAGSSWDDYHYRLERLTTPPSIRGFFSDDS